MKIWKYELSNKNEAHLIEIPFGGKILSVQLQDDHIQLWAQVNPTAQKEARRFWVFATGEDIKYNTEYLGTVQHGPFVWHVYEEKTF